MINLSVSFAISFSFFLLCGTIVVLAAASAVAAAMKLLPCHS